MRLSRRLLLAFAAAASIGGCRSPAGNIDAPLRVLVYNIHAGKDAMRIDNLERVAAIIKDSRASIVLLQEVDRKTRRSGSVDQLARLRELTGYRGAFGKTIDYDGGEYGIAILSRWRVASTAFAPLPVEIAEVVSRARYEERGALVARVVSPFGIIRVVNTHLDAGGADAYRIQQARVLTSLAGAQSDSGFTLLGGDMNSEPASEAISILSKAGWADLFAGCGTGEPYSFPADKPVKRIDFLFASVKTRCLRAEVLDTQASDHRPVLFEVIPPARD
jgi:endonuclease/exonuclease/phosphatase family metal-dependent hydrolase